MINKKGLYVHIPFCESICSYCAFSKVFYNTKIVDKYLIALKKELKRYDNYLFKSIYIGGGTPTSLNLAQLEELFLFLQPYMAENAFICIETNPNLDDEKIELLKKYGVQRISIGIQTFNEKYLKLINRKTSYEDIRILISKLRENGVNNINVDLIYGFENQTIEEVDDDINKLFSLNINHISTYCLQIEEGTILYNKHYLGAIDDLSNLLYNHIVERLEKAGFHRYEVSNFAKDGYQSFHNLIYWNNEEYGGVGLAASSYIDNKRKTNTKNLTQYLLGNYEDYEEILSSEDEKFYFIMLALRKTQGLSLKEYKEKYNEDFYLLKKDKIDYLINQKLLVLEDNYLMIDAKNFFIMDFILRKLIY